MAGRDPLTVEWVDAFSVEGGADNWLRIPYALPEESLVQAVQRIASVWKTHADEPSLRRPLSRLLIA